jgi:hypothetical protein
MIDYEAENDVTSFQLIVKKPEKLPFYCKGFLTNLFLDKAFNKDHPDNKQALEEVKNCLWRVFKDCYLEKVD